MFVLELKKQASQPVASMKFKFNQLNELSKKASITSD